MGRWQINYHVACQLQKKLLAATEVSDVNPKDLCALTSAWERLEERKRILRMKPKPRDIDVTPKDKPKARPTFTE